MIFAKNSDRDIIVAVGDGVTRLSQITPPYLDNSQGVLPARNLVKESYEFKEVDIISEEDAYQHYRMKKIERLQKFNHNQQHDADGAVAGASTIVSKCKAGTDRNFTVGLVDVYIIPKLYNYFPFLDCDTQEQYDDCCSHLKSDGVRYVSYQSSNRKNKAYWIFCDKAMNFDDTIKFIKQYPADGRYAWIAGYKREFCVRAIPKKCVIPARIDTDDSDLSRDFKFWLDCFDDYWKTSKLIEYILLDEVANNV